MLVRTSSASQVASIKIPSMHCESQGHRECDQSCWWGGKTKNRTNICAAFAGWSGALHFPAKCCFVWNEGRSRPASVSDEICHVDGSLSTEWSLEKRLFESLWMTVDVGKTSVLVMNAKKCHENIFFKNKNLKNSDFTAVLLFWLLLPHLTLY